MVVSLVLATSAAWDLTPKQILSGYLLFGMLAHPVFPLLPAWTFSFRER